LAGLVELPVWVETQRRKEKFMYEDIEKRQFTGNELPTQKYTYKEYTTNFLFKTTKILRIGE
jgi:hypothetical protein